MQVLFFILILLSVTWEMWTSSRMIWGLRAQEHGLIFGKKSKNVAGPGPCNRSSVLDGLIFDEKNENVAGFDRNGGSIQHVIWAYMEGIPI